MSLEAYRAHQGTMRAFLDSQGQVMARLLALDSALKAGNEEAFFSPSQFTARAAFATQSPPEEAPISISRYTFSSRAIPATRDKSRLESVYLVVSRSPEIATSLERLLGENGALATTLPIISLNSADALKKAVEAIRARLGPIAGIVFAQAIGRTEMAENVQEWRKENQSGVKALFFLLQACANDLRRCQGQVLALSAMGGCFGRSQAAWQSLPTSGAAVGLLKTAAIEWPDVTFKAVDFEDPAPEFVARAVLDELLSHNRASEIGYPGQIRHAFEGRLTPLPPSPAPQTSWQIEADWVVFVTGGARGITAEVLREILQSGMTVHIVGRALEPGAEPVWSRGAESAGDLRKKIIQQAKTSGKVLTPASVEKEISAVLRDREIRKNLSSFRGKGARVVYHSADVRNEVAVETILRSIYKAHARIDAVIHGAGVIEDKLLLDKTAHSFDRVFDTKADSTYLLSRYLRPESLKCLVFFASVAGRTGNRGQCDYAAVNELVNRFAWWLHHRWTNVRISSINWGPWENGMASAEVNRQFQQRGVTPIPPDQGRAFFKREVLFAPPDEVEIVAGFFSRFKEKQPVSIRWPFVHGRAVQHNAGEASVDLSLCVKDYPFLADHRIDGKVVVPWAVAVELMAQSVQAAWPQWQILETHQPQQLGGIVIEEASALSVRVTMSRKERAEPHLVKAMISSKDRAGLPVYRAAFLLGEELVGPPLGPSLAGAMPGGLTAGAFYGQHLFHGPSFRLLQLITGLDTSGVDAVIIPSGQGWPWLGNSWIFHPGVLDTAMQIGSFWTQEMLNSFALPVRAARLVRYGAYGIGSEELRGLFRIQSSTPHSIVFDFFVVDKSDKLLLRAEHVQMTHSRSLLRLASQGPPV